MQMFLKQTCFYLFKTWQGKSRLSIIYIQFLMLTYFASTLSLVVMKYEAYLACNLYEINHIYSVKKSAAIFT